MRISNPNYFATSASIPTMPILGRVYYKMLVKFDGAIYAQ